MLISEINDVWQFDRYGSTTFVYHFLFSDILTNADPVAENIFQHEIRGFGNNHAQLWWLLMFPGRFGLCKMFLYEAAWVYVNQWERQWSVFDKGREALNPPHWMPLVA